MLKLFRKVFWVPYEDSSVYPDLIKTMDAISQYCEQNGLSCHFSGDEEVTIDGTNYEIYRGYANGSRGNYGIKCREK